jgi:homoserine kinase
MNSGLKVIAPASVSNLNCGFDTLGMALDIPGDEIIGRWTDTPGIHIVEIAGEKTGISADPEKNTAGISALALLHHLGEAGRGLELRIRKHIPAGSGLGSSASSATAAVVLVNALLNHPLEKRELIPFALEGEKLASGALHGDNVVPAMIGGLILIRDIQSLDYHRIYTPPGLFLSIVLPRISVPTKEARALLTPTVPLHDMVKQTANLGSFVIGMHNGDFDLIRRSMVDHVIEPQRQHLIPHFSALKDLALSMGALSFGISGAGPAVFAMCQEKTTAMEIADALRDLYENRQTDCLTFVSSLQQEGTMLM